ncbi:hypothetical protein [Vagococcus sp. CY53-2]|uniref:hypothetical protein n=1 Tax=Vagococcus sp. CY53-2 TaxID=2925780 RepID=UPI001F506CA1|nr:hypothetical protein [Vagococcus sp. CY53-2]MCI0130019.1 hypothetical protein [Vagococcus sp. CY53-2]
MQKKTYKLIYKYDDVSSVLDRVIEEKVRSIFYGNPVEFFTKEKCKLECKTYFENYDNEIKNFYTEIVARRNIIIHNQSRVDSKFIKEVPTTLYKKGNKIVLSENYLRGTIALLIGLGAGTANCFISNVLGETIGGKLKEGLNSFERSSREDWFSQLLEN